MRIRLCMAFAATVLSASVALAEGDQAEKAASLPGGASSLVESYQDWSVDCRVAGATKICRFSQRQASQESGQSLLTIEFQAASAGELSGALALPFGLRLADGIAIAVDGKAVGEKFAFSTCLAIGCLVPIRLEPGQVARLKAGTKLEILAVAHDTGQRLSFPVSLAGFSAAASRTATLTKP